jgi:D-alanyl-D-alanine carboxypeptidase/D-alanyl-D-alanine-endopeptidase (penicillin-binding protein 4)
MFTTFLTLLTLVLSYTITGNGENAYQSLTRYAKSIPQMQNLKQGQWSVYIINTENGQVILDINGEKSLAPASNLKLLTSAVALSLLDENRQFQTYLEYSGSIDKNGTLTGNLYIRGEGDPTLGSSEINGVLPISLLLDQWLEVIRAKGIQKIKGDIIADDSYLDFMPLPGDWFWEDMGNYYAAGTSGLCINENMYRLYFKPGKKVGQKATVIRTEPEIPGLKFFNHMKTGPVGSGDKGFVYGAPWQYLHQLEGTIPAGVKEFSIKGALPDPAKFAARSLHDKLLKNGIEITGQTYTVRELNRSDKNRKQIHVIKSPPLKDIIYRLNKRSVNIYCEQLLKIIAKEIKGKGTFEDGIRVFEEWLEKRNIYTEGLFLHDGSGLSRANATPTRFFAEMLNFIRSEDYFETYFNTLSIAGDPNDIGYMKKMCKGTRAAKNVRAKTGLINRVRAHSGYVSTRSGKLLCFSMIANDYQGSYRAIDKIHEKIMIQLAELP